MNYSGTLLGMVLGFYLFLVTGAATVIHPTPLDADTFQNALFLIPILILSWIVIILNARKFLDSGIQRKLRQFINAPIARDFIAISLLGISSGLLFLMFGHSWDYTHGILLFADVLAGNEKSGSVYLSLGVATAGALVGIVAATLLSGSFRWSAIELRIFSTRGFCRDIDGHWRKLDSWGKRYVNHLRPARHCIARSRGHLFHHDHDCTGPQTQQ